MIQTNTKRILADSLISLLKKQPIEEITVEKIVEKSECSRTTFYRHFRDKYELMNWIYEDNLSQLIRDYPGPENRPEVIRRILIFLKENKEYFQAIMKYKGQNSFHLFVEEIMLNYYLHEVIQVSSAEDLPPNVCFALNVFVRGLLRVGFIKLEHLDEWEPKELSMEYYNDCIPDILKPYLK